ncbi:MAG: hypothetical protein M1540_05575 [Candidatus Bathyarchaeota archaeon]|nr:hypothetical protein [Candidatus Bathyarchaeota archaeon]
MNRAEAVNVYKEIVNLSERVGYNAYNLKLSDQNDPIAQNYQIRITMPTDALTNQQIASIAKKHDLAVKEESGEVIVYQPKKFSKTP